jgi:hypothetical protein
MGIEPEDRIVRVDGLRHRPLTVIALCEDPRRAWVIESFNQGLIDGNAYVIDLDGYRALKP